MIRNQASLYVNSRIYVDGKTGIKYYIQLLYSSFPYSKSINRITFLQTKPKPRLGKTKVLNVPTLLGAALFDLILVLRLVDSTRNTKIFHGPSHILPMLKPRGYKFVVTIHDLSFLIFDNNKSIFSIYYRHAVGRSIRLADKVIADSNNTMNDIVKFYGTPKNKIQVIYPGIGKAFLGQKSQKRVIAEKYFLSVSTHPKRKNIISVLKAFTNNIDAKELKYVIAGLIEKQQRAELEAIILNLNLNSRVIIFGYATEDQLVNLYQHAEFFIYPSYYEGFGFPVLEAMASHCPVITSNNSSLIEITPDKSWLVNPYDIHSISTKMSKMINLSSSERRSLIRNNVKFSQQFSWSKAQEELRKIFEGLIS